jgi:hypothetical protein
MITHTHTHTHTVGEITKLFGESEGLWEVGEIKKMLENENY